MPSAELHGWLRGVQPLGLGRPLAHSRLPNNRLLEAAQLRAPLERSQGARASLR